MLRLRPRLKRHLHHRGASLRHPQALGLQVLRRQQRRRVHDGQGRRDHRPHPLRHHVRATAAAEPAEQAPAHQPVAAKAPATTAAAARRQSAAPAPAPAAPPSSLGASAENADQALYDWLNAYMASQGISAPAAFSADGDIDSDLAAQLKTAAWALSMVSRELTQRRLQNEQSLKSSQLDRSQTFWEMQQP